MSLYQDTSCDDMAGRAVGRMAMFHCGWKLSSRYRRVVLLMLESNLGIIFTSTTDLAGEIKECLPTRCA